jgi:hypothetical protein
MQKRTKYDTGPLNSAPVVVRFKAGATDWEKDGLRDKFVELAVLHFGGSVHPSLRPSLLKRLFFPNLPGVRICPPPAPVEGM